MWTVWALCCLAVMVALPGHESIAYHLGWVGFALAFGFGTWSRWQLVTSLTWYTLASGIAMERSWLLGRISWDETTEIPLMFLLALLTVWSVRRSRTAHAQVTKLAERDVQASRDRSRLMQLTSHELRTPLTIAQGYIELIQARAVEHEDLQDATVRQEADELIGGVRDDDCDPLPVPMSYPCQCRWAHVGDRLLSWTATAHVLSRNRITG